jgi:molecular chaperone GrpE
MSRKIFIHDQNKPTEANIEAVQNTDPASDPSDAATTGVDGSSAISELPALIENAPAVPMDEYDRLKAERDQLFDRVARLQAEFDNARKREIRERTDFRDFAVAGAIEQFLPALDNFQLALKSSGTVEQLRTGVELIAKQMEDALRNLNVTPVETVGTEFDPRFHEALGSEQRVDLPDQQVFEEIRRGYRIKDRLLRPALVRVVDNPKQKEA